MILRDCLRTALFGLTGLLAIPIANAAATQIGVIVPESWPDKAQAEEIRNGMLLSLKTWPGQPAPPLVINDSACHSAKSAAAARALIDVKFDVVLGCWCMLGSVPKI